MKQLQNNFTTPEQSKRLLELGVPADSADCFYLDVSPVEDYVYVLTDNRTYTEQVAISDFRDSCFLPCWSVGRLIEIIMRCHKYGILFFSSIRIYKTDILNNTLIDDLIKYMPEMDFSKLED